MDSTTNTRQQASLTNTRRTLLIKYHLTKSIKVVEGLSSLRAMSDISPGTGSRGDLDLARGLSVCGRTPPPNLGAD